MITIYLQIEHSSILVELKRLKNKKSILQLKNGPKRYNTIIKSLYHNQQINFDRKLVEKS